MRSLFSLTALLLIPLGNALASDDWIGAGVLGVVVAVGIWAISADAEPSLSRLRAEPASRLGPDGLPSTIAGERQ